MGCREPRSHERGVYPTQDTSRMGTARVNQDEEVDNRIIVYKRVEINPEENSVVTKGKSPKQCLASAEDLTVVKNIKHPILLTK